MNCMSCPRQATNLDGTNELLLEPHLVKTFLMMNAANPLTILRATTQYLVLAVLASYSIHLGRIAPQNPFKMANLTTEVGKEAIAMWDQMSQISSPVHPWRDLWDYVNRGTKSSRLEMHHLWFNHDWSAWGYSLLTMMTPPMHKTCGSQI